MHIKLTAICGIMLALTMLLGCNQATPTIPIADLDIEAIKALLDTGEHVLAQQALEAIIAEDTENAEAYFLLGLTRFKLGAVEPAREAFNRALELDPERAGAIHHNLGSLAYQESELETAEEEFKIALELEPDDSDSHYQLGATYLMMALPVNDAPPDTERIAQAQAKFKECLELAPDKAEALVGLGHSYLLQNNITKALEVLEKAVEKSPQMPEALFALGRTYAMAGETEQAQEILGKFLATNPPTTWRQQAEDILNQLEQ
ncbi:MAG: tetratricopeptide repeat protein [Anaerolineae bacterium]|nr:tetratricopeptide repeat protein [Anaerolineae bacterium]